MRTLTAISRIYIVLNRKLKRPGTVTEEKTANISKKIREESNTAALLTSSPVRVKAPPAQWALSPIRLVGERESRVDAQATVREHEVNQSRQCDHVDVCVKIKWPSKDRERKLPEDLESLGKMLARGTYKQIATAAWKNPSIKKELTELMARDIDKECNKLCSKKNPSCLRKTDKESILSFTMQQLYEELEEKAPIFHRMLHAASINKRSQCRTSNAELLNAGTAMAAAICLRNRSKNMIAVQLIVTIFLYHNNWLVSNGFPIIDTLAVYHSLEKYKVD